MGEIIRFIPKAELERIQLIRQTRAIYESIFPSADAANEQRYGAVGDANVPSGGDVKF
jgi:hypothetical protein